MNESTLFPKFLHFLASTIITLAVKWIMRSEMFETTRFNWSPGCSVIVQRAALSSHIAVFLSDHETAFPRQRSAVLIEIRRD